MSLQPAAENFNRWRQVISNGILCAADLHVRSKQTGLSAGFGLPAFFRLFVEIPIADFCCALAGPAFSGSFAVAAYAGPFAVGALFGIGAGLDVFFVDSGSNGFTCAFPVAEAAFFCSAAIGAGAVAGGAERAFLFVVSRGAFFHPRT
jgi:hypothetical protein